MAIPRRIRIEQVPDYYTRFIGRCADGRQFMAFVVASLPTPVPRDWRRHKRWYTVLHTFDGRGRHVSTEARFAGTTADGEDQVTERAQSWRQEMLARLNGYRFCDVEVRLFSALVDGSSFGLVDTTDEELGESVTLWPNDLVFHPPWDGSYDT